MRPVRVLLAARKKDLRVRLRRILSAEKTGVVHVGEAANGSKAIKLVSQASPDVIVISLDLSGPESMELIRRIKELEPATRILVLSDEINKDKIMQLFDSGISGFSTISEASEHLVSGIHACMNLVVWLSPIVHERLFKDYSE